MRGKNQEENKKINKNLILKLLITKPNMTRIALAKITGLTKMAVSNIIGELIADGVVMETGSGGSSLGRKPILMQLVPKAWLIIGLYISRTVIESFTGDLTGCVWGNFKIKLDNETTASFKNKLLQAIEYQMRHCGGEPMAIGISSIGPLDCTNEIILNPPNFFGIENVNIYELFEAYHLPIFMENDMNTAAVAEKYFGKAKEIENYIYVGVTNGIGAGIIAGGRLYTGDGGFSGEIGHISVDANGKTCSCGNVGCLELFVPLIKQWADANLNEIYNYLGAALTTVTNLFDPKSIYLGHDISKFSGIETILGDILNRRILASKYKKVNVELSEFGENAPIFGAIAYAIDRMIGSE